MHSLAASLPPAVFSGAERCFKFPMLFLTQQLIDAGVVTAEQAAKVEAELAKDSGKTEEEVIIAQGFVEEKKLFELKSRWLGISLILDPPEDLSLEILETIPEETANFYRMIPLGNNTSAFMVGMVCPEHLKAPEALQLLARQNNLI